MHKIKKTGIKEAKDSKETRPQGVLSKGYEDEEDSPHEGMMGDITQLTDKPVRTKKKNKIGFY